MSSQKELERIVSLNNEDLLEELEFCAELVGVDKPEYIIDLETARKEILRRMNREDIL